MATPDGVRTRARSTPPRADAVRAPGTARPGAAGATRPPQSPTGDAAPTAQPGLYAGGLSAIEHAALPGDVVDRAEGGLRESADAPSPYADGGERTAEMGVHNMAFLIDKLYSDCSPGQFMREFTVNGLQAISLLPAPDRVGRVIWTIFRPMYESTTISKLCCIDTGVGMTGPEMTSFTNQLAKSGHTQSKTDNFGVGGKVSAVTANPEGIIYLSWKDGKGSMVILWRDPVRGTYGLRPHALGDGRYGYWAPVSDEWKPAEISDHGTAVIFLGRTEREDTMTAPEGVNGGKRWILRYLNTRFFRFPAGTSVEAAEGWHLPVGDKHRFNRDVTGLEAWLRSRTQSSGTVTLTNAKVHWYVVTEAADVNSGHYPSLGLVAALWKDELYDMAASSQGRARLQQFGIVFGMLRVALIVEPIPGDNELMANLARTTLLLNNEPLPWTDWAAEFREKIPAEIAALIEEAARKTGSDDHRRNIAERLKDLGSLFQISRYRATRGGSQPADRTSRLAEQGPAATCASVRDRETDTDTEIEQVETTENETNALPRQRNRTRTADYFARLVQGVGDAVPAEEAPVLELPRTFWVSRANGKRQGDDLEDRAARYLPDTKMLMINADFRVFTDMEDRWTKNYAAVPNARAVVRQVVQEWFEQQLVEAVLSAKALEGGKFWMPDDAKALWSEQALTAVVLPRFHVDRVIKRTLGERIASLHRLPAAPDEEAVEVPA